MLSDEIILDAGYIESKATNFSEIFDRAWYKVFSEGEYRYQIIITKYDQSLGAHWNKMKKSFASVETEEKVRISYTPDAQLILPSGDRFNVEYLPTDTTTIEDIETFFKKLFTSMCCIS
ncbi:hypothetical protein [Paenibacillus sp. VTT E-133291]|uniref:hypothetical protein n=1 Tax=Paenibacillus sp. VTT E-133291 TaxID=1986223 RepID=UPI000BA17F05|nr:hypothetical protein [Paenibacillus sp. VTT E-133291]OZQ97414.1 hypothetical protein CA598_06360 [Paenibacillus sp. VTT E-133291]